MEQIVFTQLLLKNEHKSSKRTVDNRPCPECSSVHTPISSSLFLHLDLLINYSIIIIIYSTFYLFVYKMRRINSARHRACLCVQKNRPLALTYPLCKSSQVFPPNMLLFCPMTTKGSALKKV